MSFYCNKNENKKGNTFLQNITLKQEKNLLPVIQCHYKVFVFSSTLTFASNTRGDAKAIEMDT